MPRFEWYIMSDDHRELDVGHKNGWGGHDRRTPYVTPEDLADNSPSILEVMVATDWSPDDGYSATILHVLGEHHEAVETISVIDDELLDDIPEIIHTWNCITRQDIYEYSPRLSAQLTDPYFNDYDIEHGYDDGYEYYVDETDMYDEEFYMEPFEENELVFEHENVPPHQTISGESTDSTISLDDEDGTEDLYRGDSRVMVWNFLNKHDLVEYESKIDELIEEWESYDMHVGWLDLEQYLIREFFADLPSHESYDNGLVRSTQSMNHERIHGGESRKLTKSDRIRGRNKNGKRKSSYRPYLHTEKIVVNPQESWHNRIVELYLGESLSDWTEGLPTVEFVDPDLPDEFNLDAFTKSLLDILPDMDND